MCHSTGSQWSCFRGRNSCIPSSPGSCRRHMLSDCDCKRHLSLSQTGGWFNSSNTPPLHPPQLGEQLIRNDTIPELCLALARDDDDDEGRNELNQPFIWYSKSAKNRNTLYIRSINYFLFSKEFSIYKTDKTELFYVLKTTKVTATLLKSPYVQA